MIRKSIGLLLLAALSLNAETWTSIGSAKLGPAPGNRFALRAAASRHGVLAAWWDERSGRPELYAARMTADGEVLDPAGLLITRAGEAGNLELASDGEDYLLLWTGGKRLCQTTIRADGTFVTREGAVEDPPVRPRALVWDGRQYAFVFSHGSHTSSPVRVQLLDRGGEPSSGRLNLYSYSDYRVSAISARTGKWLVGIGNMTVAVDESMFPPLGRVTTTEPPRTSYGSDVLLGRNLFGNYVVTRRYDPDLITVRREGTESERTYELSREWILGDTIGYGPAIFVSAYRESTSELRLLRLVGPTVTIVQPGMPAEPWVPRALLVGPAGPMLFWSDRRDLAPPSRDPYSYYWVEHRDELYAAIIGGERWKAGGTLVSASLPRQTKPEIEPGPAGTWLAVWLEEAGRQSLVAATLDRDARATGETAVIGEVKGIIDDIRVAFDGVNYLVVWHQGLRREGYDDVDGGAIYGRFVDSGGHPRGDAFEINRNDGTCPLASLLWNGSEYFLTTHFETYRISASGLVLDSEESWPLLLAPVPVPAGAGPSTPRQFIGLEPHIETSVVSAGPLELVGYEVVVADAQLSLSGTGQRFGYGWNGWYDVAPAVAGGPDRTWIAVVADPYDDTYIALSSKVPYSALTASRIHAVWNSREFLVAAGATLARHKTAAPHELIAKRSLGEDVMECTAASDGPDAAIVLRQRGAYRVDMPRIEAARVTLP